ncbi:TIGR04282 family arsenosugar biosynthesis glycosyltransferase [Pseudonocardia nigra]|uniref:TIGR04282 family arsenosugar biosynthesis glycosyltransferase n=1 Tax=Pseudonocardia nigra TaxID=1921578 RepID=UPI001C6068A8|nr:DUF2064 domain-containing protein [Pseudonocardia nigra]
MSAQASARLTLLVMAKSPEPGRVKTRLCPPATAEQAADLAAAALLDTIDAVAAFPAGQPVVALAGCLSRAARSGELVAALRGIPTPAQRGTDLGQRIAAAHVDAAALLPGRPTLQLGMDTPQVNADLLAAGAAPLLGDDRRDALDAVLGPAADGGWWVLGLRDPADAALVADVPTSRSDTGERTLRALRGAGLRVGLLTELTDIDTAADVQAVRRAAPGTRFAAAVDATPAVWARGC